MTITLVIGIIAAVCFVAFVLDFAWRWQTTEERNTILARHRESISERNAFEAQISNLKEELTETQATCGIWQFKVKRLEEQVAALERGNQELQLQIDAAPNEPAKPVRAKVAKAKGIRDE